MADPTEPPNRNSEKLFLEHLSYIEAVAAHACRTIRLSKEDAEDFASEVRMKLIADDYKVFRKFQERSSLKTYLLVVVRNALLDWLDRTYGKWRHSATALAIGETAMRVEELQRDGFSFDEILSILPSRYKIEITAIALADLMGKLPHRVRKRLTGEDDLKGEETPDPGPEEDVLRDETGEEKSRLLSAAAAALETLPAEDRLLFLLIKVEARMTVAQYARARRLNAKDIYRRLEKARLALRRPLEAQGFRKESLNELFPA